MASIGTSQEHRKRLQGFLTEFAMPFAVLLDDGEGGVWSRYGKPLLPAMFFVDTAGIVRAMYLKGHGHGRFAREGPAVNPAGEVNAFGAVRNGDATRHQQEDCMQQTVNAFAFGRVVMRLGIVIGALTVPVGVSAQGCMPLHFTTPSLGGEGIVFLHPHQWQVGLAARRVATNKFYVGDTEKETAGPFGQGVNLRLNSADLSITYAMTEQTSLSVVVPFFYGTAGTGQRRPEASPGFEQGGWRYQCDSQPVALGALPASERKHLAGAGLEGAHRQLSRHG